MEKNSMIGYKLFRKVNGKLFPLFVSATKEVITNKWLESECGEMTENGKVKSRLGELAYRSGWHLNDDAPYVNHIYTIHDGKKYLKDGCVWCEVEYKGENVQEQANKRGYNAKGNFIPKLAYLNEVPKNSYYKYKTNPTMNGAWVIADCIKITRELADDEVNSLCAKCGYEPLPRYSK